MFRTAFCLPFFYGLLLVIVNTAYCAQTDDTEIVNSQLPDFEVYDFYHDILQWYHRSNAIPTIDISNSNMNPIFLAVINRGLISAKTDISIFLSEDVVLSNDDSFLGIHEIEELVDGKKDYFYINDLINDYLLSKDSDIPTGIYYLIISIDANNLIQEIDESNNQAYKKILIIEDENELPDLIAERVYLRNSINNSLVINRDLRFYVDADWFDDEELTDPYTVNLYLSKDNQITNKDQLLQTYFIDYLLEKKNNHYISVLSELNKSIKLPENIMAGSYFLGILVDPYDKLIERSEINNSATIQVHLVDDSLNLPDLKFTEINFTYGFIYRFYRKEGLINSINISNTGNSSSESFSLSIYLSKDSDLSDDDCLINKTRIEDNSISPDKLVTVNFNHPIILPENTINGSYHLIFIIDQENEISEYNDFNNIHKVEIEVNTKFDEILLTQGKDGLFILDVRNTDVRNAPIDKLVDSVKTTGHRAYSLVHNKQNRGTYTSVGNLDDDEYLEFALTYGPITETPIENPNVTPNYLMPADSYSFNRFYFLSALNNPLSPFPYGNENPVQYKGGELRTAIGNFLQEDENLIAVAQGFGSKLGLVRLFKNTGLPAPNGWKVVSQFQPLDDRPTQNNANGGVTLAAGDIDGDGIDELLAGQTNSPTSLTQFTVIDIDADGQHIRHNYTAFPQGYRGLGGIEMAVADLNGDGTLEIVAVGKGYAGTTDIGNVISVIEPVIENQSVIGYTRPTTPVIKVVDDAVNPGGGLSIAAGEFDGNPENGQEIVIGSGNGAPQSFYRILKIQYELDENSHGKVKGFYFLNGERYDMSSVVPAFIDYLNPKSGEVYVNAADVIR